MLATSVLVSTHSETVQALEQRIATLEAELKSTRDDVNILKSAVSFLSMQSSVRYTHTLSSRLNHSLYQ